MSTGAKLRLVWSSASPSWGGEEMMAATLMRGLESRGHEVTLFCRPRAPLHQHMQGVVQCEPFIGGFDFNPRLLELRTRMGDAGRAKVARCYTLERILDAHEALLDRITSRQL